MGPVKIVNDKLGKVGWKKWKEEKKEKKEMKIQKFLESEQEKQEKEKVEAEMEKAEEENGRNWTISLALPGNILDNVPNLMLKTLLAGHLARAIAIFNIDEVVIFDENGSLKDNLKEDYEQPDCCTLLGRLLQYQECPQYLRKYFFPQHDDLRFAGMLNPLDIPHHVRREEKPPFREGYVTEKVKNGKRSMIDIGLEKPSPANCLLTPGLRVTAQIYNYEDLKKRHCKIVSPNKPLLRDGTYWGYNVRFAESLGAVFTKSPYEGGYDLLIGTSERGKKPPKKFTPFKHALIAFGGLQGLELGLKSDNSLKDTTDLSLLFDYYLNTCPNQGTRTIRTEEAILVSLSLLQKAFVKAND